MSTKPFQFRQFKIKQDKTAMKVGTDGVLLGAWVEIEKKVSNILDIGTGTGLIALQIAQRCDCETIDALEIESSAFEQAVENFEDSDWGNRLFCYHASLDEFIIEFDEKYDLILSNPPFYTETNVIKDPKRALARQSENLTFDDLLENTAKLLSKNGTCAFIIPYSEEITFLKIAQYNKLFPSRITRVRGNKRAEIKRSLLQLSFNGSKPTINELTIEINRHDYTEAYKNLVKEFYLKL